MNKYIILIFLCLFLTSCKEPLIGDPKMMSKVDFGDAVKVDMSALSKAGTVDISSMTINIAYNQKKPIVKIDGFNIHLFDSYPKKSIITKTIKKYGENGKLKSEEIEIIKPENIEKNNLSDVWTAISVIIISSIIGTSLTLLALFLYMKIKNGR